jgi:hypothetical protein
MNRRVWTGVAVVVVVAVAALAALLAAGGEGPPKEAVPAGGVTYLPGKRICRLAGRRINESSGVTASKINPGVFWTHNDSGDDPRLYAFNKKGEDLGSFDVDGGHRDWEDICSFKAGEKGYILAADTGDNARRRGRYKLYLYEEPRLDAKGKLRAPKLVETISFTYGDGKSHDGEAIAAAPGGRTLYIVTRNRWKPACKAFRIDRYEGKSGTKLKKKIVAEEIAALAYRDVSALDISSDGLRMMVQTYRDAYQFVRKPEESWKQALKRKPGRVKLPFRGKGEGCCFGPDDKTLYLTSEGGGCPLYEVPVKKAESPAKKAGDK